MPVAHAILGALMEAPAHGYSIKKYLGEALPDEINDGQLYPTLARMERQGWIRKQVVEQRRSPTKHLYRITRDGEREFFDWLCGPEEARDSARRDFFSKFEFLQRCAFFRHLGAEEVEALTRAQIDRAGRQLERLEKMLEELRLRDPDPYRDMIVKYGIRVQQMRREWLLELLARAGQVAEQGAPPLVAGAPRA